MGSWEWVETSVELTQLGEEGEKWRRGEGNGSAGMGKTRQRV